MPNMPKAPKKAGYHHGRLREALLDAALALVQEEGALAVSLREVARRAGVSHAAPAHHFGDKAGLLTALATEGFVRFTAAQRAGAERGGSDPLLRFSWLGWAYVMFAAEHRAYFEVMFRPELLRRDDPALAEASLAAYQVLLDTVRDVLGGTPGEDELAMRATVAWAQAHGLATLWIDGNLAHYAKLTDLDALARQVFGLPPSGDSDRSGTA
jgi:AcrR family transcriptional regulator